MINTYTALIVPFFATPWAVFMMRQFLMNLPNSVIHSARIDGASEFRIYRSIILPLSRPVLSVMVVIGFLNSWNEFLWPVVAVREETLRTLPLYLSTLNTFYFVNHSEMMATALMATVPILVMFIFLQKQFIAGLTYGSFR